MSYTSKATSEILVAGLQDTMFVIDVNKGEIVKQVSRTFLPVRSGRATNERQLLTSDHYIIMKISRYICAATKEGSVNILDPTKFNIIRKWQAHSAYINDMDVQQDFVVTCGASYKQQAAQTYMLDPYVNVFDLKNMNMMSPIPFPPLAAYVRMHPRMVTTGIVVSQTGQMHVVDLMNPNTSNVRQANVLSFVTMIEIAPSGEAIALADTECYMHLWGSPSKVHFAEFPNPVEFPEAEEEPQANNDWTPDT
jgi:PAB-dependent poly(A)-specific ribonuclease subunit 2